jgi:hypothetical protein
MALVAHRREKWLLATEILGGKWDLLCSLVAHVLAVVSLAVLIVIIHLKKSSGALVAGFILVLLIHNRLTSYSGLVRLILLLGPGAEIH